MRGQVGRQVIDECTSGSVDNSGSEGSRRAVVVGSGCDEEFLHGMGNPLFPVDRHL